MKSQLLNIHHMKKFPPKISQNCYVLLLYIKSYMYTIEALLMLKDVRYMKDVLSHGSHGTFSISTIYRGLHHLITDSDSKRR